MSAHTREPLFETAHGRVRRCPCCDCLELRFGNALLALAVDELPTVLAQLGAAEREPAAGGPAGGPATDRGHREVTLFVGDSGCGWVFTADETAELHRLVAGARLMLDLGGPAPGTAAA